MSKQKSAVEELSKMVGDAKAEKAGPAFVPPRGGPCNATYIENGEMVLCALELGHEGPHLEEEPT